MLRFILHLFSPKHVFHSNWYNKIFPVFKEGILQIFIFTILYRTIINQKEQFPIEGTKRKQLYDTNHENTSICRYITRLHLIFKAMTSSIEFTAALTPMKVSTRIRDRCLDGVLMA